MKPTEKAEDALTQIIQFTGSHGMFGGPVTDSSRQEMGAAMIAFAIAVLPCKQADCMNNHALYDADV